MTNNEMNSCDTQAATIDGTCPKTISRNCVSHPRQSAQAALTTVAIIIPPGVSSKGNSQQLLTRVLSGDVSGLVRLSGPI